MKKIKTSNGQYALVDNEDYDTTSRYKWHITAKGYVVTRPYDNGKKLTILWMHRMINNTPKGFVTDHVNHNKLDNRRSNLRTATDAQNMQNRSINANNKTGYKGVHLTPSGRYRSRIRHNKTGIHLGMFDTPRQAYLAYRRKAKELWGEFA